MGSPLMLKYFLHMLLFLLCSHTTSSRYLQETDALNALKAMFNNTFLNDNWTGRQCFPKFHPPWYGVNCAADAHVTGILLEGMGLTGEVTSDALFNLVELTVLSFKNNSISGNIMNFSSNQNLSNIDLSSNRFSGPISPSLLSLNLLESLQLQDNSLTGPIPDLNQTSLKTFNVSNNKLSGLIPPSLRKFGHSSYSNNPELCDSQSPNDCNSSKNSNGNSGSNSSNDGPAGNHKSSGPNFATMFFIFDVVGLVAVILLFVLYYKKASKLKKMMMKEGHSKEVEDDEENEDHQDQDQDQNQDQSEDVEKSLKKTESGEQRVVIRDQETGKLTFMGEEGGFELPDLLRASAEGLGKGSFGNSYKAKMEGRPAVVVKRIKDLKPLSVEEFTRQLQIIANQKHPNLLPLLAYYYSNGEKMLVYKYAENGNLFNRIHGGRGGERIPFRWSSRLSVARGVARALEYLHINTDSQNTVPHGNLKPSNVLLDENETVLVSDYGLPSLIALPIAAQRMVSYKSPEYQAAKKVSKKSDVWSYGSLLLELLTGRISVHSAPPAISGVDLCNWVHRAVREEWTAEIFDNEINVQRSAAPGMLKLLQIAIRCCDKSPEERPEMTEVVREVESIKLIEYSDESDLSLEQSLTDESLSTTASVIVGDERRY